MTPDRPTPAHCEHHAFAVIARVNHMEDTGNIVAEIQIRCTDCDESFRFLGVTDAGLLWDRPSVSMDELTLNVPIEPQGQVRLRQDARYVIPQIPVKH